AQTQLNNARSSQAIRQLPILESIQLPNTGIDFVAINRDLQTSIDTIRDTALEELFDRHCADLGENGLGDNQRWLRDGYTYVTNSQENSQDINCPFCQQIITPDLDIIRAYSQKFNDIFNALTQALQTHLEAVTRFDSAPTESLIDR